MVFRLTCFIICDIFAIVASSMPPVVLISGDVLDDATANTATTLHIPVANHPPIVTRYHVLAAVAGLEDFRLAVLPT
jgi:hypothetical protein